MSNTSYTPRPRPSFTRQFLNLDDEWAEDRAFYARLAQSARNWALLAFLTGFIPVLGTVLGVVALKKVKAAAEIAKGLGTGVGPAMAGLLAMLAIVFNLVITLIAITQML